METYVVRVWVPDRPGALGQVASRIGSVGGDVVGIDILERGAGKAIDELVVTLPSSDLVGLLVTEIGQVDDAAVEEIHHLHGSLPEPGTAVLELVARVIESASTDRMSLLCGGVRDLFTAEWVSLVDLDGRTAVVSLGERAPAPAWLIAFAEGSKHLPAGTQQAATPTELTWAELPRHRVLLGMGRSKPALRAREHRQVALLGRIVDAFEF